MGFIKNKLSKLKSLFHKRKTSCAPPPRTWSNMELKKFSSLFTGSVVNVSGWEDKDKEGGFYRDYFVNASSYSITNYSHHTADRNNEVYLNLEEDLAKEFKQKFDIVYNHTTLEHIFDINKAFSNLCDMSRDIVILVVPFIQQQHETPDYYDYWRMTPTCIDRSFEVNGFTSLHNSFTNTPYTVNYIFSIGSRFPEKWKDDFEEFKVLKQICDWAG